jgi:glyoxylase-like metal-dependent hydrolase (beta-lactamase superfamily II)
MDVFLLNHGNFKLDGGAMFGVVPKTIWQKTYPADDRNLCALSMRSLLIADGKRLILVDTGIGNKQDEKFFSYYHLHGDASTESSLKKLGFSKEDITDVLLTHLHLDHAGGAVVREGGQLVPAFKNAVYHTSEKQWDWAIHPNDREKASFLKENILPLQESGRLNFIEQGGFPEEIGLLFRHGHTEAMVLPKLHWKGHTIVFAGDLFPTISHLPVPYVAGYDVFPLTAMEEKRELLEEALAGNYIFCFQHDAYTECCTLQRTEKGIRQREIFKLEEL